ncbi:MFS transporter [Sulfodiicoccus acidiphilus]|nr:MFS transporter [Sulfodiicoccus acidiphilus]BBD73603.1 MFS transporter [Sulfodiicoccus acidiphilus]
MGEEKPVEQRKGKITRYQWFIFAVALLGWTMASFDLNLYSINLPLIAADLHLSAVTSGILTSVIFAGATAVIWGLGPLLDLHGRKTIWQISLLFTALFTGFTILVANAVELGIVRVLSDGFSYIEFPTGLTIANEEFPATHRGSMYGWVQGGFPLGYFVAIAVSLAVVPLYGWRVAFLVGIVPILVVLILRRWVKEPERSKVTLQVRKLLKEGKRHEAEELIKRYKVDLSQVTKFPYRQMFTDPKLKKHTVITTVAEFFHELATPALFFFTSYVLVNYKHLPYTTAYEILLIATFLGFLGYGIMGHVGQRISRKWGSALIGIIGGVAVIFFALSHGFLDTVITTVIFYPAVLSWNGTWWVYIAETYPTRARGTADSWQTGLNDFAWIVGSAIYGFVLEALGFTLTYIVLGAVPVLLGAIIIAALGKGVPPTAELEEIAY